MKNYFRNTLRSFWSRDWIQKGEGKLTYMQFIGFLLIFLGVLYLSSFLLPSGIIHLFPSLKLEESPTSFGLSIAFFTTMLGVAFAFPDMLKGQTKEISTMRIVVFMFANVICMLMLKTGWDKESLADIGLDGYWMGVIAFLFGAKATQSFFENAKSFANPTPVPTATSKTIELNSAEIARLAVIQNRDVLMAKYPNIESVSDSLKHEGEYFVTIYVRDDKTDQIPKELTVTFPNGTESKVETEIIADTGSGRPQCDEVSDTQTPEYLGSLCCMVESGINPTFLGAVTSGHVFTFGDFKNYGGFLGTKRGVNINRQNVAQLYFQQMKYNQDLAVVELSNKVNVKSFPDGFYTITETDLKTKTPNITIESKNGNIRTAYILDHNVTFDVKYFNGTRQMQNIILIGDAPDREKSKNVSQGGDSGSCVYHTQTGKLIGMLLGGNEKFTFVLPLQDTLKTYNFKLI